MLSIWSDPNSVLWKWVKAYDLPFSKSEVVLLSYNFDSRKVLRARPRTFFRMFGE